MGTANDAERLRNREAQVKEAEELLGQMKQEMGFAKALYFGRFHKDWLFPYPAAPSGGKADVDAKVDEMRRYCAETLDADAIDRRADIPRSTIEDLARMGILGLTAPKAIGGAGFTQADYCRVLEVLGGACSSTSIFVNAHHSIGMRALILFGTEEQKKRWLPDLVSGKKIGAFALTEPEAGSDAANVQTIATPTPDGKSYVLKGGKRYITNAAIADVLTVMARTPVEGSNESKITAFLVTPDMPGFKITKPRGEKMGIRGTATGWLEFNDMIVPKENVLGPIGKGLKVALTVLDFGRTTFGACCTGAAKTAMALAVKHAKSRRQFKRSLAEFELVRKKIGQMAGWIYAMEAMTYCTADLIDRGFEDFMLETAMLKVWTTDALWTIINDSFQIHGGAAYFCDMPLERMVRDARINQIGEGANEVLKSFIALVGLKGPGEQLKSVYESAITPWKGIRPITGYLAQRTNARLSSPKIEVGHPQLMGYARDLGRRISRFGAVVQSQLFKHREEILEKQYVHERIAEAAMELYASSCVLSRLDAEFESWHETIGGNHASVGVGRATANGDDTPAADGNGRHSTPTDKRRAIHRHKSDGPSADELAHRSAGEFFLQWSLAKIDRYLDELDHNQDDACDLAAKRALDID